MPKPKPVYYDEFGEYDDIPYTDKPPEKEIVYAGYTYEEAYEGSALIVFIHEGKWYENNDAHCSCNGLEDWGPEETTPGSLLLRDGWPGLLEAVEAHNK